MSVIASKEDGIYYNHMTNQYIDIDYSFKIEKICQIIHDPEEGLFYILVNKHLGKLGLFLI